MFLLFSWNSACQFVTESCLRVWHKLFHISSAFSSDMDKIHNRQCTERFTKWQCRCTHSLTEWQCRCTQRFTEWQCKCTHRFTEWQCRCTDVYAIRWQSKIQLIHTHTHTHTHTYTHTHTQSIKLYANVYTCSCRGQIYWITWFEFALYNLMPLMLIMIVVFDFW